MSDSVAQTPMSAVSTLLSTPALVLSLLLLVTTILPAEQPLPEELEGVGITEKLGAKIDMNLEFINESGYPVKLGEYFNKDRPVILNLVYYNCPMLCTLVLNAQTKTIREIPWTPGEEYDILTISIDPRETFDLAQKKKALYLSNFERPAPGWHFLSDHQGNVKKLAEQIGFNYKYDERREEYAHSAAIMVLTADGTLSRYLYGIRYKIRDMRLALTEASDGKVGTISDRVLLFCFHYDPSEKSYVPFATNIMRGGGVLIVLIMGIFLVGLWRRERYRDTAAHLAGA
jgi:protein SCO1